MEQLMNCTPDRFGEMHPGAQHTWRPDFSSVALGDRRCARDHRRIRRLFHNKGMGASIAGQLSRNVGTSLTAVDLVEN